MKKDLLFEKINQILQESFNDHTNTKIHHQYKIENRSGQKREIDILIEMKVNNIDLLIAIECKDYARKIEVGKIEEFAAKCQRIPKINKKLFISRNGYQKDAINAAKEFGIELLTLEEILEDNIEDWFKKITVKPFYLICDCLSLTVSFINSPNESLSTSDYINFIEKNKVSKITISNFIKTMRDKYLIANPLIDLNNNEYIPGFKLDAKFTDTYIEKNGTKFFLKSLVALMFFIPEEIESKTYFNSYGGFQETDKKVKIATSVSKDNIMVSLIKKSNKAEFEIYMNVAGEVPFKSAEIKITKEPK